MTEPSTTLEGRKSVPMPSPPSDDKESRIQAENEERQLEKARNEHVIDETSRKIIGWGSWMLLGSLLFVLIASVLVLGWHLLAPKAWEFLEPEKIQSIKDLILSGAVVGLGTNYFRRYLERHPRS